VNHRPPQPARSSSAKSRLDSAHLDGSPPAPLVNRRSSGAGGAVTVIDPWLGRRARPFRLPYRKNGCSITVNDRKTATTVIATLTATRIPDDHGCPLCATATMTGTCQR